MDVAIEIQQRFTVAAPVETVWRLLLDPSRVVTCLPGAQLEQQVDEHTVLGAVQVKLGAITSRYQGRVRFVEVDEAQHRVRIAGEGREAGGGTARGALTSQLVALPEGGTEVVAEARIDLTGRIQQMGRGLIQGVGEQLFREFAARVRGQCEDADPHVAAAGDRAPAPASDAPLAVLPLLWRTLRTALGRWWRRLLGRPAA